MSVACRCEGCGRYAVAEAERPGWNRRPIPVGWLRVYIEVAPKAVDTDKTVDAEADVCSRACAARWLEGEVLDEIGGPA